MRFQDVLYRIPNNNNKKNMQHSAPLSWVLGYFSWILCKTVILDEGEKIIVNGNQIKLPITQKSNILIQVQKTPSPSCMDSKAPGGGGAVACRDPPCRDPSPSPVPRRGERIMPFPQMSAKLSLGRAGNRTPVLRAQLPPTGALAVTPPRL